MQEFLSNLSLVLAHSVLYETKAELSPGGIVDDARNGGDPPAPSVGESTADMMKALIQYGPELANLSRSEMLPTSQAQLSAAQITNPGWTELQNALYSTYGPQLAQTAQGIDASSKMAAANADAAVLAGPGKQIAQSALDVSRISDPEFYSVRSNAAGRINELLGTGLTPGESEAIQRSLNQQNNARGLFNVPSATNTVANAMTFGDAARNRTLQGVQAANSFLPASRTNFDPTALALGRPSTVSGDSKFLGAQTDTGASSMGMFDNMMNNLTSMSNNSAQINSQRRDSLDRFNQTWGSTVGPITNL